MVAWELRRVLLDLSVEKRCNKWLRDNRSTWEELFEVAGGSWKGSVWPSITAFRATNPRKAIPCHFRDEYQIITRALLVMLFHRAARGRNPESRDKAMKMLESVLGRLNWPPPNFSKNPGLVPRVVTSVCFRDPDNGQMCKHPKYELSQVLNREGLTLLERVVRILEVCLTQAVECHAAGQWYRHLLGLIESFIDENVPLHAVDDPLQASNVVLEGDSRKRRLDQDLREAIVQTAVEAKRARTPMAFARASGIVAPTAVATWIPKHMGNLRAAMFMSFAGCQNSSLAFSAGRVGSSKEEALLVAACVVEKNLAQWLAPQVPVIL